MFLRIGCHTHTEVGGQPVFHRRIKIDALIQISALCIKSGNCAILKGGKETARTNKILFSLIHQAVVEAGLPEICLLQVELHNEIDELLQCQGDVDLLIPRGSNRFVQYIMDNTNIPVMGHSSGICHIFVEESADLEKAVPIIVDAKTQYPAACNAVETLLIQRKVAKKAIPAIFEALWAAGVKIRGTQEVADLAAQLQLTEKAPASACAEGKTPASACAEGEAQNGQNAACTARKVDGGDCCESDLKEQEKAGAESQKSGKFVEIMAEDEFDTEYTDTIISVKLVENVEEAVEHINRFGSHHTDSILTKNDAAAEYFLQMVDSAGVYRNCSTRFSDGFRYGFGAEVGISTGKLHARGPVGLDGLVTYKYRLSGDGQIVGDYASGRKEFHHRDL